MSKKSGLGVAKSLGLVLLTALLGAGSGVAAAPNGVESGNGAAAQAGGLERLSRIQMLKERQVGAVHPLTRTAGYLGSLPEDQTLAMTISFQPNRGDEISALLAALYNPASPNFHKWLSPEQWADRFGRSTAEVAQAAAWLRSSGFTVNKVWENRLAISFTGSTAVVRKAFNTQMGLFRHPIEARSFFANLQRPQLPPALDAITISLTGLSNAELHHHPDHSQARPISEAEIRAKLQAQEGPGGWGARPNAKIGSTDFLGPQDLQLAYGYQSLISGGVANQGSGQSIGNIIDSDVQDSDINGLRSQLGLPQEGQSGFQLVRDVPPTLTNPGKKFQDEAELDLDTISAAAPDAVIHLILIPALDSNSITTAENYAVNTLHLPVVNESFGGCESSNFDSAEQTLFQQAAAAGTAFFASAGDEGVACSSDINGQFFGVELPAAYDSVTAVGGTTLQGTFNSGGTLTAVASDVTWNTAPGVRNDCTGTSTGGGATGGGVAATVSRPSYQTQFSQPGTSHGVPAGSTRVVPDVALVADPNHTTLLFEMQGSFYLGGGTSQASPLMAGLMTLVNQYKGATQGLPNSELYRQGALQYANGGPSVFRDITSGNNTVQAVNGCPTSHTGFSAAIGYDAVTGWGAPQVGTFAQNYGVTLAAPTNLLASSSTGQFSLSWTAVTGATSYNVYQGSTAGGEAASPVSTGATGTSVNLPALDSTTAYFKVTAVNGSGQSAKSNEASATTPVTPAPTGLTATPAAGQVTLQWTNVPGHASYRVYVGTSSGHETQLGGAIYNNPYAATGLAGNTTYYFKVAGASNGVVGPQSAEVSATTPAAAPPTNVGVVTAPGQGTVSWTASPGATSYNIYVGNTSGGESSTPSATSTGTSAVLPLSNSRTYYFTVKAVSNGVASAASSEVQGTTPVTPAPTNLTATSGTGQVTLQWTDVPGHASYRVYVGTSSGAETQLGGPVYSNPYIVTGLTSSTTYFFKVAGASNGVVGPQSAEVSANAN